MILKDVIVEDLKKDEGFRSHAYEDHLGYTTIGYGRMVDERLGGGISKEEAEILLSNDVERVVMECRYNLPFFDDLKPMQQRGLVNMCFQLGLTRLLKFEKMLLALKNKDGNEAYKQALDSKWAKQTPARAQRVAEMIRGDYYDRSHTGFFRTRN